MSDQSCERGLERKRGKGGGEAGKVERLFDSNAIGYDTTPGDDIKSLIYTRSVGRILISALFLAAGVYFVE